MKLRLLFSAALALCAYQSTANAEVGVTTDRILFGQSAAMDGAAKALGQGMFEGINAAFDEANRNGGVKGRKLELVSYDDGYEPEKAIANTNRLIDQSMKREFLPRLPIEVQWRIAFVSRDRQEGREQWRGFPASPLRAQIRAAHGRWPLAGRRAARRRRRTRSP